MILAYKHNVAPVQLVSMPKTKKPKKSSDRLFIDYNTSDDESGEDGVNAQAYLTTEQKVELELQEFEKIEFSKEDKKYPRQRWKDLHNQGQTSKFPTLTRCVRKAFSVPIGNGSSERKFSVTKLVGSNLRKAMNVGNLLSIAYHKCTKDLEFVKKNTKIPDINVDEFRAECTSKDPVELCDIESCDSD